MRALAFALVLVAITGCVYLPDRAIEIKTDPYNSHVCPANRPTTGTLAIDDNWGLGLKLRDGNFHGVIWPFRYSARRENGIALLINDAGSVEAREGDDLEVGATVDDEGIVAIYCSMVRNLS